MGRSRRVPGVNRLTTVNVASFEGDHVALVSCRLQRTSRVGPVPQRRAMTSDQISSDSFHTTLRIAAAPDRVYTALTSAQEITGWWATAAGDADQGGRLHLTFGGDTSLDLTVVTAIAPHTVRWLVTDCDVLPDWANTEPGFSVTAADEACDLRLDHIGLRPQLECYDRCSADWVHFLHSLRAFVETGHGFPVGS